MLGHPHLRIVYEHKCIVVEIDIYDNKMILDAIEQIKTVKEELGSDKNIEIIVKSYNVQPIFLESDLGHEAIATNSIFLQAGLEARTLIKEHYYLACYLEGKL